MSDPTADAEPQIGDVWSTRGEAIVITARKLSIAARLLAMPESTPGIYDRWFLDRLLYRPCIDRLSQKPATVSGEEPAIIRDLRRACEQAGGVFILGGYDGSRRLGAVAWLDRASSPPAKEPSERERIPTTTRELHSAADEWRRLVIEAEDDGRPVRQWERRLMSAVNACSNDFALEAHPVDDWERLQDELAEAKREVAEERAKIALDRESFHLTYNGGWQTPREIEAFHHGMDTVFNALESLRPAPSQSGNSGEVAEAKKGATAEGKGGRCEHTNRDDCGRFGCYYKKQQRYASKLTRPAVPDALTSPAETGHPIVATPEPEREGGEVSDDLARLHKTLDDLALYVFRCGKDPSESFRAVELLQEMSKRHRLPITATFAPEFWKAGLRAAKEK